MTQDSIVYKIVRSGRGSLFAMGTYHLTYLKGNTVKAPPDSLGCMCFRTLHAARAFSGASRHSGGDCLQVRGIGEAQFPEYVSAFMDFFSLRAFYVPGYIHTLSLVPEDTVCYPEVYVLD